MSTAVTNGAALSQTKEPSPGVRWCVILGLIIVTIISHWPVLNNDFVRHDDGAYLVMNSTVREGLTLNGVLWAFSTTTAGYWHPITWLSHMVDVQLFKMERPGLHHAMSLAIHAANAALVLVVLMRMTGAWWRCTLVAAFFALHPLRVESVAWAAERKDVLSALFGLLALRAYASYAARPSIQKYAMVASWMTLSLMSKPMLVTLPCLLLLLDVWPLRRALFWSIGSLEDPRASATTLFSPITFARAIIEKLPLLAISAIFCVIAFYTQNLHRAMDNLDRPLPSRLANAIVSYTRYVGKTIWPSDLSFFYSYPLSWAAWKVAGAVLLLVGLTTVAIILRRRNPYLLIGWLWFLGTLVPVIGLVQVGAQSMGDRFTYFPQIGLLIALVWGAASLVRTNELSPSMRWIAAAMVAALLLSAGLVTNRQTRVWKDAETLYLHALSIDPNNHIALHGMGMLRHEGQVTPEKNAEAVEFFRKAVVAAPERADLYIYLAQALLTVNDIDGAIAVYEDALRLDPANPNACNNLAWFLATHWNPSRRDGKRAVELALRVNESTGFKDPSHLDTLAAAQAEYGNFAGALETARKAHALALEAGIPSLATIIQEHIDLLTRARPIRITPP